jgi:hypothetical protein
MEEYGLYVYLVIINIIPAIIVPTMYNKGISVFPIFIQG